MTAATIPVDSMITPSDIGRKGIGYALDMATANHPVTVIRNSRPTHVILSMDDYMKYADMAEERNEAVNELARYEAEHGIGRSFTNLDDLFADLHSGDDED